MDCKNFSRPGATRAVVLDLLMLLTGFGTQVYFPNSSLWNFTSGFWNFFCHFLIMDGFGWFLMERFCKEYPVNVGVPQCSILGVTLFLLYINGLRDDVNCNIAIYADNTSLYSKCNWAFYSWLPPELAFELEFDTYKILLWTGTGRSLSFSWNLK